MLVSRQWSNTFLCMASGHGTIKIPYHLKIMCLKRASLYSENEEMMVVQCSCAQSYPSSHWSGSSTPLHGKVVIAYVECICPPLHCSGQVFFLSKFIRCTSNPHPSSIHANKHTVPDSGGGYFSIRSGVWG